MKKFYNIDQIVSVEKFGKGYGIFEWRPRRKWFWLLPADPEGYWRAGGFHSFDYIGPLMPENFAEDQIGVYRKPHLEICFSDGSEQAFYYEDQKEMESDFDRISKLLKNTIQ